VDTIVDVGGRNPPGLHGWMEHERGPVPPGEAINERALTGGVKQTQCVGIIAYHHSDRVVIKYLRKQFENFTPPRPADGHCLPLERIRWEICSSCMKLGDRSS
jgi:hypothetical protein